MSLPTSEAPAVPAAQGRTRSDSLIRRLRAWLTPAGTLPALGGMPRLRPEVALSLFHIDTSTRQLLDPACRRYAYQVLRERGFPNRLLSLDGTQLHWLASPGALLLSPMASARWLSVADRPMQRAEFSFLYQPFTLACDGDCLVAGRILPPCSRAVAPWSSLRPTVHADCLLLVVDEARPAGSEDEPLGPLLAALAMPD